VKICFFYFSRFLPNVTAHGTATHVEKKERTHSTVFDQKHALLLTKFAYALRKKNHNKII